MAKSAEYQSGGWLEVRRIFPLLAGLLILTSIFLPFWSVSMTAPQYPEKDLTIRIYANKMVGDIWEFNALNQYAGVKFPDNIPEFKFLPALLGVLAVFSIVTAFVPAEVKKKLLPLLFIILLLFLVGAVADLQWRLYQVGHNLDPNAPLAGMQPFTPPVIGKNKIANFTTLSLLRSGGISVGIAFILTILAFVKRNSAITVAEWGSKLWSKLDD